MDILDQWGNPLKIKGSKAAAAIEESELVAQLKARIADLEDQLKAQKQLNKIKEQTLNKLTKSGILVEDLEATGNYYEADSIEGLALKQWKLLGGDRANLKLGTLGSAFEMYSQEQANSVNAAKWASKTKNEQIKAFLNSSAFLSEEGRWRNNLINIIATSGKAPEIVQILEQWEVPNADKWQTLIYNNLNLNWTEGSGGYTYVDWEPIEGHIIRINIDQYSYSADGCGVSIEVVK